MLSIFILFSTSCTQESKELKPNFIIFIADDAAWDDSGAYGNGGIQTPNIDNLAKEGLLFTNAFVSTSSCSPSRCSIMTGLYPHNTGAMELHMPLPADRELFVGELKRAGYYTASAGKWHLGPDRSEFDSIYHVREPSGSADWLRALQNRPRNKPFFLWLAAIDPHRGYEEGIIPNPHSNDDVQVPPFLPDNGFTRKDLALYYDEITRFDTNLGSVMSELKFQNVDENTLVIYMTDNGRPFPRCKTRLLDSGLKTPFIVRWPGKISLSTSTNSLISSIDIAPTLCELAGLTIPEHYQGVSFAPVLLDPAIETRDYVVGEHNWHDYQAHERSLRTKEFLYIRNSFPQFNASPPADAVNSITYKEMIRLYNEGNLDVTYRDSFLAPRAAEELYDVINDPFQQNDLSGDSRYQTILNQMRMNLDQWITDTNDKVPDKPTPDMFDRFTGEKMRDIREYRLEQEII
jgi:arylsulfatase A-like enzyme